MNHCFYTRIVSVSTKDLYDNLSWFQKNVSKILRICLVKKYWSCENKLYEQVSCLLEPEFVFSSVQQYNNIDVSQCFSCQRIIITETCIIPYYLLSEIFLSTEGNYKHFRTKDFYKKIFYSLFPFSSVKPIFVHVGKLSQLTKHKLSSTPTTVILSLRCFLGSNLFASSFP